MTQTLQAAPYSVQTMAHPDLDQLLNAMIPFAQEMLAADGDFYPFGASIDKAGEGNLIGAETEDEHPSAEDVINLLLAGFRDAAGKGAIRAVGICFDVFTVPPGEEEQTDAICVRLEHADGEAASVYLPYQKAGEGEFTYGELFAGAEEPEVFV